MLNKELLIAASSQAVDPGYVLENSYFEVTLRTVTRAVGSGALALSFYTPFGLVLNKYTFEAAGSDDLFIPSEQFNKMPFDLSEMVGYRYLWDNAAAATNLIIEIMDVNSDIVPYKNVHIHLDPLAAAIRPGVYTYYHY